MDLELRLLNLLRLVVFLGYADDGARDLNYSYRYVKTAMKANKFQPAISCAVRKKSAGMGMHGCSARSFADHVHYCCFYLNSPLVSG